MTRRVMALRGEVVLVDKEDFDRFGHRVWRVNTGGTGRRFVLVGPDRLHRAIMQPGPGQQVDHINGDPLDNRRSNLRLCTPAQNSCNRGPQAHSTSGFKGVSWHKVHKRWTARIRLNHKRHHIGCFDTAEDAARAYDDAARRIHGPFAFLNFPTHEHGEGSSRPAVRPAGVRIPPAPQRASSC